MILESIRKEIENLPKYDYQTLFLLYVMKVQDTCIANEIDYMFKHNIVDPLFIDREITNAVKELKEM